MTGVHSSGRETTYLYILGTLGLAVILLAFWVWAKLQSVPGDDGGELTVTAFSIGKADALLWQQKDTAVLVDAGEEDDGEFLKKELEKRGIGRLDLLLITHFDKDHVGGAAYLLDHMEIRSVMMPDYEGKRPEYRAFMERIGGHPDVQRVAGTGQAEFSVGALSWTVYAAEDAQEIQDTEEEYDNDLSLVASVRFGERTFLLTGDIEKTRIGQMLASDTDWRHDWIKMPRHGRWQKAAADLADAVRPSYAVICCSRKNPADEETVQMLLRKGIPVWDTSGQDVVTRCDGEHITVSYE